MPEFTRTQLLAYGAIALAVIVLGSRYLRTQGADRPGGSKVVQGLPRDGVRASPRTTGEPGERVAIESAREGPRTVHVAGAVRRPGVYRLRAGARVQEAVRRAGGATSAADLAAINLAAKVEDGRQVLVPARAQSVPGAGTEGPVAPAVAGGSAQQPPPALDLNVATVEQLDTLDGVGPATAQKIVAYRSEHNGFRSVDELGQVPGIGEKRLAALRERVRV